MKRLPQIALLPDGKRLHLQDGPIDLIIEANGDAADVRAAYEAATRRFTGLLDELCGELTLLRQAADPARCALQGVVARRMHAAVAPFAARSFHHADGGGRRQRRGGNSGAMLRAAPLDRAYVNNGGDIALHLTEARRSRRPDGSAGSAWPDANDCRSAAPTIRPRDRHQRPSRPQFLARHCRCRHRTGANGGAGRCGRDHHRQRGRSARPSRDHPLSGQRVQPDSDLGARLVTRQVGFLEKSEIDDALKAGTLKARQLLAHGLIEAASR